MSKINIGDTVYQHLDNAIGNIDVVGFELTEENIKWFNYSFSGMSHNHIYLHTQDTLYDLDKFAIHATKISICQQRVNKDAVKYHFSYEGKTVDTFSIPDTNLTFRIVDNKYVIISGCTSIVKIYISLQDSMFKVVSEFYGEKMNQMVNLLHCINIKNLIIHP